MILERDVQTEKQRSQRNTKSKSGPTHRCAAWDIEWWSNSLVHVNDCQTTYLKDLGAFGDILLYHRKHTHSSDELVSDHTRTEDSMPPPALDRLSNMLTITVLNSLCFKVWLARSTLSEIDICRRRSFTLKFSIIFAQFILYHLATIINIYYTYYL